MVEELHARLDHAIGWLGGLQQPRMSTEPPETDADRALDQEAEREIREVVLDVGQALLGIEITLPDSHGSGSGSA